MNTFTLFFCFLLLTCSLEPQVVINEIMYDVSEGKAEFVEIYNNSEAQVNLKNWSLHDEADLDDEGFVIEDGINIESKGYLVLAWNESIKDHFEINNKNLYINESKKIILNNSGDIVAVKNNAGVIQDSVYYEDKLHNEAVLETKDISLERIMPSKTSLSPENWTSCIDETGGTPGSKNSVSADSENSGDLIIKENPYVPFEISGEYCLIMHDFDFSDAAVTAEIYSSAGAFVSRIKNNEASQGKGVIRWNGTNEEGYVLQPGPYVLLFRIKDLSTDKIHTEKALIVIGK